MSPLEREPTLPGPSCPTNTYRFCPLGFQNHQALCTRAPPLTPLLPVTIVDTYAGCAGVPPLMPLPTS